MSGFIGAEPRCSFHQASLDSHFSKKKLISIATEDGRITLTNSELKITRSEAQKEITFEEKDFENKLKQYFNIEIKST